MNPFWARVCTVLVGLVFVSCHVNLEGRLTSDASDAGDAVGGADGGGDGTEGDVGDDELGPNEAPAGLTLPTWKDFQSISPKGGIAPPTDPTNQYSDDPAAAKLGHYLFYEEGLSPDNDVSCASCHQPDNGFAEPSPLPVNGAQGEEARPGRHTPTLLNVAYGKWYFWDGRRDSLWSQAILPYESSVEMAGTRLELAHFVYETPKVKQAYEEIFGSLPDLSDTDRFPEEGKPVPGKPSSAHHQAWTSMSEEDQKKVNQILVNVMKSIAAFEMKLVSLNSDFDKYVDQIREYPNQPEKRDAISDAAKRGAKTFVGVPECNICHGGPMLMQAEETNFFNLGLPARDYLPDRDTGRFGGIESVKSTKFNAGGPYSDAPADSEPVKRLENTSTSGRGALKGAFKIPSLRNLPDTAPYMHGGHFSDLQGVLEFYNDPPDSEQVGTRSLLVQNLELNEEDISDLKVFLESLDGEPVPQKYKSQPDSPLLDNE